MKNKFNILYFAAIIATVLLLTACNNDEDKDSYGISKVTSLPKLTLTNEGEITVIGKGSSFVEPGYTALAGTVDITNAVLVKGSVNTSVAGMYTIEYVAVNPEGFTTTKMRNVFVADLTDPLTEDISGEYTSNVIRTTATASAKRGPYTLNLEKLVTGLYYVDDFLGGWYWIGSNYGTSYAYDGIILVKSSGEVVLQWSNTDTGWGDGAVLNSPVYIAATKTFTWGAQMGDASQYMFNVTLVKK